MYLSVLEENPYIPKDASVNEQDRQIAEKILEESMSVFHEETIYKQIDEALDANDRDRFFELSAMLKAFKAIKKDGE
ncbi:IDEAL domain-containing protein [Planococcus faecalis]